MARQPKTDKQCAQTAVAASLVVPDNDTVRAQLLQAALTTEELVRAATYLQADKPVTGR
jgi:hypothetical protein